METPYFLTETNREGVYFFITDRGVEYKVSFEPDDLLTSSESYQFLITNVNHKKSPRDPKVRDTILLTIEEFFRQNNTTLLYICETGDGKQLMRSRLFDHWYMSYKRQWDFLYMSATILDADGEQNFTAMVLRKDNPNLVAIVSEFTETVQLLSEKPGK